jgi:hypothetical protein
MATVKVNAPPPQPVPETTYDLLGLTRVQMLGIRKLIGGTTSSAAHDAYSLYVNISEALDGDSLYLHVETETLFPDLKSSGKF